MFLKGVPSLVARTHDGRTGCVRHWNRSAAGEVVGTYRAGDRIRTRQLALVLGAYLWLAFPVPWAPLVLLFPETVPGTAIEFELGTDTVHAPDEYVPVDVLVDNAVVYAQLPTRWQSQLD